MSGIFFSKFFSGKHVPQMAPTVSAKNFNSPTICIGYAFHISCYFIIKAGPAATRIKLIIGVVKWIIAAPADKSACCFEIIVFAGKGLLCSLMNDNSLLLGI